MITRERDKGGGDRESKRPDREKNGTAGFDFGSTYTRATIYCQSVDPEADPEPLLFNVPHPGHARPGVYKTGEWSSTGFPFGNTGNVYTGSHKDKARLAVSLKPGIVLASDLPTDEKLELIRDYPHADFIKSRVSNNLKHYSRQYELGISALLGELAEAVSAKCKAKNIRITSIGVGLPGHWPWEVQVAYHTMVYQAVSRVLPAIKMGDIHFLSETQAMTHYIFHLRLNIFAQRHDSKDKVIVLDFGGQNINISVYAAVYCEAEEKPKALYQVCPSTGIVGGSEKHAQLIGDYCEEHCRRSQGQSGQNFHRLQGFTDDFNLKKQFLDEDHSTDVGDYRILKWENDAVQVTPETIKEKFEEAFEQPLEKAESILREICGETEPNEGRSRRGSRVGLRRKPHSSGPEPKPCVIVAGGSSRYRPLRAKIEKMCADMGIPDPIFDQDLSGSPNFESHSIAQGAALSTAKHMTVREFMERGAALGLQQLPVADPGETEEDRKWEDTAPIHYRGDQGKDVSPDGEQYEFIGGEEIKIICSPFHADGLASTERDEIEWSSAYDLFTLGRVKAGRARFTMDILYNRQGDSTLKVQMEWWPHSSSLEAAPLSGSLSLPLCWDKPSCCVLVTDHAEKIVWELPGEAFSRPSVEVSSQASIEAGSNASMEAGSSVSRTGGQMWARRGGKRPSLGRARPGGT